MQLKPILIWKERIQPALLMAVRTMVGRKEPKNADITSDDRLGGQVSYQTPARRTCVDKPTSSKKDRTVCSVFLFFVCLIIHFPLSHLLKFLMHGAELELARELCPLLSFSSSFLFLKMLAKTQIQRN